MSAQTETLNPQQKEAALHRGGPLLVLAGAGTGKTRVIVHRIASLLEEGVPPGRILAVTFTNKAADEMRRRIEALVPGRAASLWAHTFHAFALRMLRRHTRPARLPDQFTVYDSDDSKKLVAQALEELGLGEEKNKAGFYLSVISRAKDDLLDPESYAIYAAAQGDPHRQTVARVYQVYQRGLASAGAVDFGDLLLKAAELLKNDESVRAYYQGLFAHVLVDEYQDTNHAQYVLTKTLAAQHRDLCVVGDPDQSIYHFRGANIRNILEFESDFKDTKVIRLEQNYRSTPNILAAATAVIANNRQRHEKSLWTQAAPGNPVEAEELSDEREEARWVVRRTVRLLDQGAAPGDVAVFYRTNAQSRQFEEAFSLARVPYRVVGSYRFYERKEVKDALAYARAALNPGDLVSLLRILNVPARGLGRAGQKSLEDFARGRGLTLGETLGRAQEVPQLSSASRRGALELAHLLETLKAEVQSAGASDAMRAVLAKSGYWAWLESQTGSDPEAVGRLDNLQELMNAVREYEEAAPAAEKPALLSRFLAEVALQSPADAFEAGAAVTLMTVHLAKGLEFPAVFLTGLEEGLFPISAANASPEDIEEERRLAYVGMTRARRELFLTYAASRRLFGRVYSSLPSRFILEAGVWGRQPVAAANGASAPRDAAPPPAPAPVLLKVKAGMRVRHPEFGMGRVVERAGSGEAVKVTVAFDSGKTKVLLLRYAPLSAA